MIPANERNKHEFLDASVGSSRFLLEGKMQKTNCKVSLSKFPLPPKIPDCFHTDLLLGQSESIVLLLRPF